MAVDLSPSTIQDLFVEQMMKLTKKTCAMNTFDYQFSDRWL